MREDKRRRKEAFEVFADIPEYDPHQMLSNGGWRKAESMVENAMNRYKVTYGPITGTTERVNTMYNVDDVIKFSNRDLVSENIAGKKFLVTARLAGKVALVSLDADEVALQLNYETILDLGGAKVGYRREKHAGFWAKFRNDPVYEIISLKDER